MQNAKLMADAVEALVGAFQVGSGDEAALGLLRHLGLADVPWDALPAAAAAAAPPPSLGGFAGPSVDVHAVEATLGYVFKNPWLVQEALTHGSCSGARSDQRLEFMGDALLDACLASEVHQVHT